MACRRLAQRHGDTPGNVRRPVERTRGSASLPFFSEEILQDLAALRFPDTGSNQAGVVERRHLQQIDHSTSSTGLGIRATKDHAANTGMNDSARAHRAGFFGNIKIAFVEAPIAQCALRLSDGKHLGVSSGVLQGLNLIPGTRDTTRLINDDSSDRNLLLRLGFYALG